MKKRLLSLMMAMFLLANTFAITTVFGEDADKSASAATTETDAGGDDLDASEEETEGAAADALAYVTQVDKKNAYLLTGEKSQGNMIKHLDGLGTGVGSDNPLYSSIMSQLGITGRYFEKANSLYMDIDEDFYQKGDSEFLVTVVYWDFGPSQGKFFFDYMDKDGNSRRVTMIKPGTVQKWNVEMAYINDADFDKTMDGYEANCALKQNAWNLFKRVEIINISKIKREGGVLDNLHDLPSGTARADLINLGLLKEDDKRFSADKLTQNATYQEAYDMRAAVMNEPVLSLPEGKKPEDIITQGELAALFVDALKLDRGDASPVEYGKAQGVIGEKGLMIYDTFPATKYSVLEIAYSTLAREDAAGNSLLAELAASGKLSEEVIKNNLALFCYSYKNSKKLPCEIISDNDTGQVYYRMDIGGMSTMRPYGATQQTWSKDGKKFICGLATGEFFIYNTETQMLTYIDKATPNATYINGTMGADDHIYYAKRDAKGVESLWKVDINNLPANPEFICEADPKYTITQPHMTNDCKYISAQLTNTKKADQQDIGRYDVEKGIWEVIDYEFTDYSPALTHVIINPEYPDILSFCHELAGSDPNRSHKMYDRMWQADFSTMTVSNVYKQGKLSNPARWALQGATHEAWSINGEYMYYISFGMGVGNNIGETPTVVRYNKDGSHRHYYYTDMAFLDDDKHCSPSGDDRYVAVDGNYISIVSTETWERFHIARFPWNGKLSHPYHAHPCVAREKYVVDWGGKDENGLLSIFWFDFTELVSNQAEGGQYKISDSFDRISYKGLECESSETEIKGRTAVTAAGGKYVFLDVSEDVIDEVNGKLKISFDYLDNGTQPIHIHYTSGVTNDNEHWRVYDKQTSLKRTGTNTWKHYEFVIDSGNFEDIGKFNSDIKIGGASANVYLSNVTATVID
ncbi:MAG: hypothetical protein IJV86_05750 [Clostridia bacterium]|nr:hypothetical protein [Clostridia bacterium]